MIGGTRTRAVKAGVAAGGAALFVVGAAWVLLGGSGGGDEQIARAGPTAPTTFVPPSSTEATTTTSPPETTTTTAEPEPPRADAGVAEVQRRLGELGYDPGKADGFVGTQTYYAISAFQRVEGLSPTGEYSEALREAVNSASPPGPMVPGGASSRVEIDINRQVLFLWRGGGLARILPVSTGSGERYCVDGDCDVAITPTGTFRIGRKYPGLEISRLGELYHPMYFYGGIAIHGSPSVPPYPASHGCVRVPMYAAASLYDQVPGGMAVYVVGDGPSAASVAPPPDEPVRVPDPPPPPPPADPIPTTPPVTEADTPDTTVPPLTMPPLTTVPPSSTTTTTLY